ncbi:heparan-alpha-glucosaminide N-acetyltransferase domain-containing protein [Maribacter sp. 2210JD10-5]|uniref:heparan-alpha-glucosaminide N-acetyltransferase domain-containing protein n=1 Tax=Maribacter sp. 2210JD10-5 TaxID=3386272 RepID=UPI0039BC4DAE
MGTNKTRLYFIDAIRAWAILMMLQGHFIDGLLDNAFRDNSNFVFSVWQYFRGITAPVFFTVSGFIFTYLLIKVPQVGWDNPRVKKGLRRGVQLLIIGYLLRLNILGLFVGEVYHGFYLVDVLHCIGLSIIGIIGAYVLTANFKKWVFPFLLLFVTLILFVFEPLYKEANFHLLPQALANYFTKSNGSVFTILPWFGYATLGGFISVLFSGFKNHKYLYPVAIPMFLIIGSIIIFFSSDFFLALSGYTGIQLFADIFFNNYLFIRLGDVLVVFAIFMLFRKFLTNRTGLRLGQNTLSIYVIHFIILYGSFTGLGLYGFFHHSLSPWPVILGASVFMISCSYLALKYEDNEVLIKRNTNYILKNINIAIQQAFLIVFATLRTVIVKVLRLFGMAKN